MESFLFKNIDIIYLFYGLVFFLLGFAISIRTVNQSKFALAHKLWVLAAFAYLHALGEWAVIFIPSQADILSPLTINILAVLPVYLWATSFLALFSFGVELCISGGVIPKPVRVVPFIIFLGWFILFMLAFTKGQFLYTKDSLVFADILARYFLGAPGAVFSAWGLYLIKGEVTELGSTKVLKYLYLAVTGFLVYGLVAGAIVPKADFFFASIINAPSFVWLTGVPIELIRSLSGFLITLSLIKVLEIFELESQEKMRRVKQRQALWAERNRISRDLHDGVIQSLYGVGLSLQTFKVEFEGETNPNSELDGVLNKIDEVIKDIRKYIQGLEENEEESTSFTSRVKELVRQIERRGALKVILNGAWDRPVNLTPIQEENYFLITKEALSNVIRHAKVHEAELSLSTRGGCLELTIKDHGQGFENGPQKQGFGLNNMQQRADVIGGQLRIVTAPGNGTEITVSLPWEDC